MNRRLVVLAFVIGLIFTWSARASAAQVAIVDAAEADCSAQQSERDPASHKRECMQGVEETVTRLFAELEAAGFSAITMPRPIGADLSPSNMGVDPAPVGVFSVMPISGTLAIEVLLTDRRTREVLRFTLRTPHSVTARAPALLAVRALELLRANALVLDIPIAPVSQAPAPPQSAPVPAPVGSVQVALQQAPASVTRAAPSARFVPAVGAAAALLYGFESLGPALAPMLTAQVTGRHRLGAKMLAVGPSFGPKLRGEGGSAQVREALAALAVDYQVRPLAHLSLLFSLGGGVHQLAVRGYAKAPFVATRERVWSAMGIVGVAAHLRLLPALSLTLGLLAYATFPRAVVHVAADNVGAVSRPSTLSALGLRVEL